MARSIRLMADIARMQRAYAMIRGKELPTTFPDSYTLPDVVDIHIHVGEGLTNPLDLAKRATRAELRALVFKTTSPSVDLANTVNQAMEEIYANSEAVPTRCYGGYVLETPGPPNAAAAELWLRKGAAIIWFATGVSANHLERANGLSRDDARSRGQYILEGGKLIKEAEAVLEIIADKQAGLSFGHLSNEEMFALAEAVERRGIKRAFVDHPFNPVIGLSEDACARIAGHGVSINFTAAEIGPMFGVDPHDVASAIRRIGIDRVILSSDGGHPTMGDPVESMRLWQLIGQSQGFSKAELRQLTCDNPAAIIGLNS